MTGTLEPASLYRLPWTVADNAMTWLEPTRKCNIVCDACFATNDPRSEKTLERIEAEVRTLRRLRRSDGMFIAGGEPLTHPRIADIVRIVRRHGFKPVLVTNGVGLDAARLAEMKRAGLFGLTFHVDSHQSRPGWKGKSEAELNVLRGELADLVRAAGGLSCGFNVTVFPDTLEAVPAIVSWALRNVDKVHYYTLTVLRLVEAQAPFNYYAGGRKVDVGETVFYSAVPYRKLMSPEIRAEVERAIPDYRVSAFLGGTARPDSLKLAMCGRLGTTRESFGNLGPRSMELVQGVHHWFRGRYLAFARPGLARMGRSALLLFGLIDPEVRKALGAYGRAVLRDPAVLLRRVHLQTIVVEQPFDLLPDGGQDHCDGCPNMTLWRDRLVAACQLEEYLKFGAPVVAVPRTAGREG